MLGYPRNENNFRKERETQLNQSSEKDTQTHKPVSNLPLEMLNYLKIMHSLFILNCRRQENVHTFQGNIAHSIALMWLIMKLKLQKLLNKLSYPGSWVYEISAILY